MSPIPPAWVHRFPRLFLNHDTYERHYWTARLLGPVRAGEAVIDVGGERGLARFLPGARVFDVNVVGPDALAGGTESLPDGAFEYAVSVDTLEHIPKPERAHHLAELVRLANRRVVFCAPIGQPEQVAFQQALLDAGTLDAGSVAYLREHLEYGMPTPEEVEGYLAGRPIAWHYSGNVRRYAVPARPPASRLLAAGLAIAATTVNFAMNVTWLYWKVGPRRRAVTNRFYGVIDLEPVTPSPRRPA